MKLRLIFCFLFLIAGCKGVQIENTKGQIAFVNKHLDIYLVNEIDKTAVKLIPSHSDNWFHSPFWINEESLGFLFAHTHSGMEHPLAAYNTSTGKVRLHNPGFWVADEAIAYSDTSVIVTNGPYDVILLQINSMDTTLLIDIFEFKLKRGLKHLKISPNKNFAVFAGLDSLKFKLIVPHHPSATVASFSDSLDDIYLFDISERTLTQLTNTSCCDRDPTWSPDGEHIAFSLNRSGNYELYEMDKHGENIKQRTDNPAKDTDPEYSPDGNKIAFISNRNGNNQIWIISTDGSDTQQLTTLEEGAFGPLSWSPAK